LHRRKTQKARKRVDKSIMLCCAPLQLAPVAVMSTATR